MVIEVWSQQSLDNTTNKVRLSGKANRQVTTYFPDSLNTKVTLEDVIMETQNAKYND